MKRTWLYKKQKLIKNPTLKKVEFDEIHSLLTMMEEIISSTDTISLEEALAGAMDFEENACQRHHKIATELFDEPTAKLIKKPWEGRRRTFQRGKEIHQR